MGIQFSVESNMGEDVKVAAVAFVALPEVMSCW
jgi:hypothetical protein